VCCVLISTAYYYIRTTELVSNYQKTSTEYIYEKINHPLQPIPLLKQVDRQQAVLGRALFNSPLLSKDNTVSCASCHQVNFGGDDGFSVSSGVNNLTGSRNSPTVLNATFNVSQFWDGRASSLGEQIDGPIHNPVEMSTDWLTVTAKLQADTYFSEAFADLGIKKITSEAIKAAIVTYEETLITPNAPIDRYLRGEANALTNQQLSGLNKFLSFGCVTCHQGVNIGGNLYQKIGRIRELKNGLSVDLGRFRVTNKDADKHVFKVPSLRNITETAPYFHDGSAKTLEEAIVTMAKYQLGRELSEQDREDLLALLEAFSAPPIEVGQL